MQHLPLRVRSFAMFRVETVLADEVVFVCGFVVPVSVYLAIFQVDPHVQKADLFS